MIQKGAKVSGAEASSRSTPPHTSTGLESGTSSPSSRLKLNFNGRVYRAGDDAKQAKLLQGLQPGQLLGQPDELTIDAAYTAADQAAAHKNDLKDISRYDHGLLAPSPAIEPISSSPAGPSLQQQDSDSDLEIGPASTGSPFVSPFSSPSRPRKRKVSQHPLDVDLPQSYQTLLSLHSALERALMLHISTEGKAGLIASAVAHASSQSTNSTSYKVEIPNLAPYTTIRGTVERGCGFQFGHKQLSQLLWVWQAASDVRIRRAAEDKARGLGFIVSKMNAPTKTGGRTATWGLGIELEIKRHVQEPALELGGASASPRKPHPHVSQSGARDGMSVVALWSQGADSRKECLKRHLGQMVLDQLEVGGRPTKFKSFAHASVSQDVAPTASARSLEVPNFTPTKAAGNTFAGGYLPTPPQSQHKSKKINIHPDVSVVDIGDFADVPLAPLPSLASHHQSGEGSTSQINFGLLQAGFEDLSPKTTSSTNKPSTKDRASSLMERVGLQSLSVNWAKGFVADQEQRAQPEHDRSEAAKTWPHLTD